MNIIAIKKYSGVFQLKNRCPIVQVLQTRREEDMKRIHAGLILSALLLAIMVSMVSAAGLNASGDEAVIEILNSSSELETLPVFTDPLAERQYLEKYESPCEHIIETLRVKNYSSYQISKELKKNGYGWVPRTGACWKGEDPTPEEQEVINIIRGPGYTPFPESSGDNVHTIISPKSGVWKNGAAQTFVDENAFFRINLVIKSWAKTEGVRQEYHIKEIT
jgi:hypothetical protein